MSDSSYNVFLIDDDEDDRVLFKDTLKEIPLKRQFVTFNNGIGLMAHLTNPDCRLPHIIFIDMNMPVMSGEECLQKIREIPRFKELPIVMYSTSYVEQLVNQAKDLGANLFVQKPSSFSLLKLILERILSALLEDKHKFGQDIDFVQKENP